MFLSDPSDGPETFAEPGGNASFADALHAVATTAPRLAPGAARALAAPLTDVWAHPDTYKRLFSAAEANTRLVDTINGQSNALEQALDTRIAIAREQTGTVLENPLRGGYAQEARRRARESLFSGDADPGGLPALQLKIFEERMQELRANHPDKAGSLEFYQPLGDQARAIGRAAADEAANAALLPANPVAALAAGFAGGMVGMRRDPLFIGSLFFGPVGATGEVAAARVVSSALRQGFFNMGVTLAEQPAVQTWRRDIGVRHGIVPALEDTALAFVFGAVPGAILQGIAETTGRPALQAAVRRLVESRSQAGDAELIAKALGTALNDDTRRALGAAGADADAAKATGATPKDVAPEIHDDAIAQALRHAEDPVGEPPPDLVFAAPKRPRDQVRVVDEREPVTLGDRETVDGKPVTFERFDPRELSTDAVTFQYKGGGDASGVTDRLRHVTQWDPIASGKSIIFERADGSRVVADGHQRLGLARRLVAENPAAPIKLDGFLFREADGWTPADVRALAAKKNMQEGSGDALDAARILRERPDLLDGKLPISGPMMKSAIALARLSDAAFGMAINGVVPPGHAAAVGAMVPDPLQHAAVMADLARFKPETEREARLLIGEAMAAGFTAEHQISLFGDAGVTRSLISERVKVLDTALTSLVRDKKLFGTLAKEADTIEAAGNALARAANDQRANDAARLADLITRLAQRTGPVSDALTRAAAQLAAGGKTGRAADAFLTELRTIIDRDGLAALMGAPEFKPAAVVEPGTPEAVTAAETAASERMTALRVVRQPERGPFADLSTGDLADFTNSALASKGEEPLSFVPGWEGWEFEHLSEIEAARLGKLSQKDAEQEIVTAAARVAKDRFFIEALPDDVRIQRLVDGEWVGAGDQVNADIERLLAAYINPQGNRLLPQDRFNALFERAWGENAPGSIERVAVDLPRPANDRGPAAPDSAMRSPENSAGVQPGETPPTQRPPQSQETAFKQESLDTAHGGLSQVEASELRTFLTGRPTALQIVDHPLVQRVTARMEAMAASATKEQIADPAFRAARVFDFDGETVTGYDAAIARLVEGAKAFSTDGPVHNELQATIVIGPPAAGKSTVSEELARRGFAAIVDSDEAKKVIPEYAGGSGTLPVHQESSALARGVIARLVEDGANMVLPKVGGDAADIRLLAQELRAAGYTVDLVGIAVDADEAMRRNIGRFLSTGRLVPPRFLVEVGLRPRETYRTLTAEGIFHDTAEIDLNGPPGSARPILDGNGALSDLLGVRDGGDGRAGRGDQGGGRPPPDQAKPDLIDSIAVASREDGRDVRFISREAALEEADRPAQHADLVAACKD